MSRKLAVIYARVHGLPSHIRSISGRVGYANNKYSIIEINYKNHFITLLLMNFFSKHFQISFIYTCYIFISKDIFKIFENVLRCKINPIFS